MKHARLEILALLVVVGLALSSVISLSVYFQNQWDHQDSYFVGEPIEETVFASYANENGSSDSATSSWMRG